MITNFFLSLLAFRYNLIVLFSKSLKPKVKSDIQELITNNFLSQATCMQASCGSLHQNMLFLSQAICMQHYVVACIIICFVLFLSQAIYMQALCGSLHQNMFFLSQAICMQAFCGSLHYNMFCAILISNYLHASIMWQLALEYVFLISSYLHESLHYNML